MLMRWCWWDVSPPPKCLFFPACRIPDSSIPINIPLVPGPFTHSHSVLLLSRLPFPIPLPWRLECLCPCKPSNTHMSLSPPPTHQCSSLSCNMSKRDLFLSSSWDDTIKLWSLGQPMSLRTFTGHTYCVYHTCWWVQGFLGEWVFLMLRTCPKNVLCRDTLYHGF
jgi:WD40 repeat protein